MTGEERTVSSPPITSDRWGRIEVAGRGFKDAKLWPGGARGWDWTETGTDHGDGVRPDDVRELLDHGAQHIVVGRGRLGRLAVHPDTHRLLDERGVPYDVLDTADAIRRYEALRASGTAVGAVIHTTC